MTERIVYRGTRLAIDSFWLIWNDKKLLMLTFLAVVAGQLVSYIAMSNLINALQTEAIDAQTSPFMALFVLGMQCANTAFAALVSVYTYDFLNNRTPSIKAALGVVGRRALSIIGLSMILVAVYSVLSLSTRPELALGYFIALTILRTIWAILTFFVIQSLALSNQSLLASFKESYQLAQKGIVEIVEGSIFIYMSLFLVALPFMVLMPLFSKSLPEHVMQAIQIISAAIGAVFTAGIWTWGNVFATKLYHQLKSDF